MNVVNVIREESVETFDLQFFEVFFSNNDTSRIIRITAGNIHL